MIYARDSEWEELALCGYSQTKRAKVFGGWIVRSVRFQISGSHDHATATESSVFIPDPKHEWLMDPKPRNTALDIKIEDLDLSVRSHNCLRLAEIDTLGDLVSRREDDLLNLQNFGKKSLTELKEQLEKHGLKL